MPFNSELLVELRIKSGASRSAFADLLGITYNYIHKIETGQRKPGKKLLRTISHHTGVPVKSFDLADSEGSADSSETLIGPDKTADLTKLINELNKERFSMKEMSGQLTELERRLEHALAVNTLQDKLITIQMQNTSPVDKGKKIAALARSAIREGELRFDEVQAFLRLPRRTLKQWLEMESGEYICKIFDKTAIATTPAEAGIKLKCFDCAARASDDCRGYGEKNYPENLFMLVAQMEANGIHGREKQAALLRESFDMNLTAHQLADTLSKHKHGKRVSEDMANMTYKRKEV